MAESAARNANAGAAKTVELEPAPPDQFLYTGQLFDNVFDVDDPNLVDTQR
jgi:hypothetical protein